MADYYSLLARAVSNLPKSSPASARRAIYDRARNALLNQLRSLRPQLPESDIAREEGALDAAIARLESELDPSAPPMRTVAPPPLEPKAPPAITRPPESPRPVTPPAPPRRPPVTTSTEASRAAPAPPRVSPFVAPLASAVAAQKVAEDAVASPPVTAEPMATIRPDNAPRIGLPVDSDDVSGPTARVDAEPLRPVAPSPLRRKRAHPWPWIAAVVVGFVGAVAVAAFLLREKPQDLTIKEPGETPNPTTSSSPGPKIAERVGGASTTPTEPTPAPTPSPVGTPTAVASPAPTPAATPEPTAQPSAQAIPVAARAAMLVANGSDTQKPAVSLGTVVWTAVPANPGQPGSNGVKADIDVPDLKMHASMVLRKNVDPGLPASHTIDFRVTFDAGSPIKGVKDIALPLMRRDDPPAADPLAGVRVKINDSYYLVGLNRTDADIARNVDAIATRAWFDFPMQLSDDRIAKLTFEKAADGERIVADALASWK